ncbi:5-formyltetrahydrofolate cyclo-ligase [Rhodobium gokarnense]|uniref:5-formyltetrahydrofolate cyclo-ligase n=1 Tax=Rhodobium gokarnense TaxID=364296 RepID=A0ABT3H714_9HYPH|nr:5-formyltetrahydrofolate cyclo-ligase [Rhodobium gokarnense]MCW2306176.1 5-formyltetrahydrofolate cyclo-ligase [Rhodobium gokarnense]
MTETPQQQKARIRADVLARRAELGTEAQTAAAAALVAQAGMLGPVSGRAVSGFWPIRGEIDPLPLMAHLRGQGARLCLPVVLDAQTLVFRAWDGDPDALVPARFGLMEPGPEAEPVRPDIMLVPLAAYDGSLNRIGYGAGYYDRAIAAMEADGHEPLLVGVAYGCQRVDSVPAESHDQPLAMVFTDAGTETGPDTEGAI